MRGCGSISGMARRCRHGSRKAMESNWACANASGCSGSSRSVSASPGRSWPEPIQRGRKGIKKAPRADGGRHRGPVGSGPSALSAGRIALPHVGPAGDQGSRGVSSSNAKERRLFRCRALARRRNFVPPRDRKIQRRDHLGVSPSVFRQARAVPDRRVLAISDNAPYHRSKLHRGWRDQ